MSFQTAHRLRFLKRGADAAPAELLSEVEPYGVAYQPAQVAEGARYWRVAGIHHLTPEENRGGHNVYVDAVDENGERIEDPSLRLRWGWAGQRPDEAAPPQTLDKRPPEPAANVVLFLPQHTWVEIQGLGLSSDRVTNLHTNHDDERAANGEIWNSRGHHSFYVLFQATRKPHASDGADSDRDDEPQDRSDKQGQGDEEPALNVITFGSFSNQDLINAAALTAAALLLKDPWSLFARAGTSIEELGAKRHARYTGPPIHELPGLTVREKNVFMRKMRHVLSTMPTPPHSGNPSSGPTSSTDEGAGTVDNNAGDGAHSADPTPSSEDLPEDDETPIAVTGNRLGFYLHMSTDQDGLWNAISRIRPPVILIHADTANRMLLQEIRDWRAPNAFIIGRMFKDVNTQRHLLEGSDPSGAGRAMADEILNYDFGLATQRGSNGRLLIDAWMSLNEPVPGPASRQFAEKPQETARLLHAYDLFQVAFHARLGQAGVGAVAFNFGAGNFNRPEHYLDHFPQTLASHRYLGFHEYGWPALNPATGAATAAGQYRTCMAGIRRRFGDRHRVIITEAGCTRMYQDASAGDVGWLNLDSPLSEDEYWRSLEWYNGFLSQDAYVLGTCLYEVGHHGGWESFRHLGFDNQGNGLGLIDRIAELSTAESVAAPRQDLQRPIPRNDIGAPKPVTVSGILRLAGEPVADVSVQLVGGADTLGTVPGAAVLSPTSVSWTRNVRGVEGDLAHVWRTLMSDGSVPLTWQQFRQRALQYNPTLRESTGQMEAPAEYRFPEIRDEAPAIVWDRTLTGFEGTIRSCWHRYVARKVMGMTYADFKSEVLRHNPSLGETSMRCEAQRRYSLPRTEGQKEYVLTDQTATRGRFRFRDLPPGKYRLQVSGDGFLPESMDVEAFKNRSLEIDLRPVVSPGESPKPVSGPGIGLETVTTPETRAEFVRTHGTEFIARGQALRFIGVNVRGLVHYGDSNALPHTTPEHRRVQIRAARDLGARLLRVFLPNANIPAEETVERLRSVITLLKEEAPDLYVLPALSNLYSDVPFRVPGDDEFYQRVDPNFPIDLLNSDFFSGGFRSNYLPFVRTVVQAFADEPAIFAWEVGNELKLNPVEGNFETDPHIQAFLDFMHATAREIHDLDPNHLVTTGMISTHHAWLHSNVLRDRLYANDSFDFLTVHCYNNELENDDSEVAARLGKPFIVEEAGYGRGFGNDRSGEVAEDMARWFARGARGYMPWGFMATIQDIGDGDGDSGLDRTLHADWNQITELLRQRADELQREVATIPVEIPADKAVELGDEGPTREEFHRGTRVFGQDWVNVRRTPGYVGKLGDDILGMLAPGAAVTVTGDPVEKDGLAWWPIEGKLSNGHSGDGWAADAVGEIVLLATTPPHAGLVASEFLAEDAAGVDSPHSHDETRIMFASSYVNLRYDPGYIGKPADHVIGQIPYGAAVTVLDKAVSADGLSWWPVRAPLLDNRVATGWAAEEDPSGVRLLTDQAPPPPAPAPDRIYGPPIEVDAILTVLSATNIRSRAGIAADPVPEVLATLPRDSHLRAEEGPADIDELEWWRGTSQDDSGLSGWIAMAAPDGTRLCVAEPVAAALGTLGRLPSFGPITQGWGANPAFYQQFCYDGVPLKGHNGIDYGLSVGTPITAIDDGKVARLGYEPGGFGNFIVLQHAWGESVYAHLSRIDVAGGGSVMRGEQIALSGNTGASTGPHLHFGLRVYPYRRTDGWGGFVNPLLLLPAPESIESMLGRPTPVAPTPMGSELPGRPRP